MKNQPTANALIELVRLSARPMALYDAAGILMAASPLAEEAARTAGCSIATIEDATHCTAVRFTIRNLETCGYSIAAEDSADRVRRFQKTDAIRRLEIEKDAQRLGESFLSPEVKQDLEAQVETLPSGMPDLKQRADQADGYWVGKIPGLGQNPASTYLGLYAFAYRNHSTLEHASRMGLNAVIDDAGKGRKLVHLEVLDLRKHGPLGQASILLGLSLLVLSARFGWPEQQLVLDAFEAET